MSQLIGCILCCFARFHHKQMEGGKALQSKYVIASCLFTPLFTVLSDFSKYKKVHNVILSIIRVSVYQWSTAVYLIVVLRLLGNT